jgi:trk system potassium uptake protein TrkA
VALPVTPGARGERRRYAPIVHFVIMGCGRVGANLAAELDSRGHSVAIIDSNPESFRKLADDFQGQKVTGIGFDRDVLKRAGIEEAFAFAAVSDGDNSNIVAARVARETFGVGEVVARIYDIKRAEIYQRIGIPTVASVRWTTDQILRRLLPLGASDEFVDPTGAIRLAQVDYDKSWAGRTVRRIQEATAARVAFISRWGEAIIPTIDTVLQDGDVLHMLVRVDDVDTVVRTMTNVAKED